ncbi:MAG: FHA domain-containing protein [Anaerolineales bacterium]|nr:FHA domain-containing protein [Anaerolineales bacterium]
MSSTTRYRLIVRKGPLPGKVYDLAKSVLIIGREVKNDIVINDSEISRQHARLTEQADGGWQVEDLASTNGTFVNGERVTGPRPLKPGDVLGLGETVQMEYTVAPEAEVTMMAAPPSPAAEAPTPEAAPGLFSLPTSEPPPAAPPVSEPTPAAVPSFSLPPSTPPAPPAQKSGIPTWAWAVGIGCAVLACCACSAVVVIVLALAQQGTFGP